MSCTRTLGRGSMKLEKWLDLASRMRIFIVWVPSMLVSASLASSQGEYREHAPHEHGHGTVDIVMEAEELVIELKVPAVNVVGFEHAPRDDAQREAIRQALVPFEDASSALVLSSEAGCELEAIQASLAGMTRKGDGHQDTGHGHEVHDDDTNGHAEHGHEEHEAQADGEDHSELHATYHLHCHEPGQLRQIDLQVLEHLHDIEEIDVRLVTLEVQRALTLHTGKTVIELAP